MLWRMNDFLIILCRGWWRWPATLIWKISFILDLSLFVSLLFEDLFCIAGWRRILFASGGWRLIFGARFWMFISPCFRQDWKGLTLPLPLYLFLMLFYLFIWVTMLVWPQVWFLSIRSWKHCTLRAPTSSLCFFRCWHRLIFLFVSSALAFWRRDGLFTTSRLDR